MLDDLFWFVGLLVCGYWFGCLLGTFLFWIAVALTETARMIKEIFKDD